VSTWEEIETFARSGTYLHLVGAIAVSMQKLENALPGVGASNREGENTLVALIQSAQGSGLLDAEEATLLHELRRTRNEVVHNGRTMAADEALTFVASTRVMCLQLEQRVVARLLRDVVHPNEPGSRRWKPYEATVQFGREYLLEDIGAINVSALRLVVAYKNHRTASGTWESDELLFIGTSSRLARLLPGLFNLRESCEATATVALASIDVAPLGIERTVAALVEHHRPRLNLEREPWRFGATTIHLVNGPSCVAKRIEIESADPPELDDVDSRDPDSIDIYGLSCELSTDIDEIAQFARALGMLPSEADGAFSAEDAARIRRAWSQRNQPNHTAPHLAFTGTSLKRRGRKDT